MTERPMCKTCPYWFEGVEYIEESLEGYCQRPPPIVLDRPVPIGTHSCWPNSMEDDWCGEHPDFAEWIDENRQPKQD